MDLDYIGSLMGMLLTIILILVLAWWVTRMLGSRWSNVSQGNDDFSVLRQINVGRNERLALVRLQNRFLLIGITSGGISLLAELTSEESEQWLAAHKPVTGAGLPSGFLNVLRKKQDKQD